MFSLIETFWNVALRRLGPEDLPDSQLLLGIVLFGYVCVQAPLVWFLYGSSFAVLQVILVELLMVSACMWGMLRLAGYPTRFRQTLVALIGTSALLTVLAVPFVAWQQAVIAAESDLLLPEFAIWLILLWSLVVDGHIISRALSRPFALGLVIAISYFIISSSFLRELVPR